jgi:hypothetical protein
VKRAVVEQVDGNRSWMMRNVLFFLFCFTGWGGNFTNQVCFYRYFVHVVDSRLSAENYLCSTGDLMFIFFKDLRLGFLIAGDLPSS